MSRFFAVVFRDGRETFRSWFEKSFLIWFAFFLASVASFHGADAATYRTANFVVDAETGDLARKIGDSAERFRADLSILWLGRVMPNWYAPCRIAVKAGETLGAGGETVYTVAEGQVFDWKMSIQGSEARLLDSVLPHEITHTIVASYLLKPAPRWIDEGMATSVEANVERTHYRAMLATFLHSKKGIAFNDMVATKEYPADLMPFYSQSFSVCEYLILVGGRRRLMEFAKLGAETNDWNAALRRYYECRSLGDLQLEWIDWVARWDAASRPNELPTTRKLRDFDAWSREEIALANAPKTSDVSNGVSLASATLPASAAINASTLLSENAGAIKSAIALERTNAVNVGAESDFVSRSDSSAVWGNDELANDGTGDISRENEGFASENIAENWGEANASTYAASGAFGNRASGRGAGADLEAPSRNVRIRNWGRGNGEASVRAQEKEERGVKSLAVASTISEASSERVVKPSDASSVSVPMVRESKDGVKWRSGAGCLADGAGSATRKSRENR